VRAQQGAFKTKYDQLGQVIEARAVRVLSDPNLSPRDLKAIAGTLVQTQKIRDNALGEGNSKGAVVLSVADQFEQSSKRVEQRRCDLSLDRCRTVNPTSEVESAASEELGNTATRGPGAVSDAPA
jgi:hypothetical protein